MDSVLVDILKFTALPVAAMILGGCIALFRMPGPRVGSSIQHFAAGMVFAAAAVELLPELVNKHDPVAIVVGFAIGIVLMLLIRTVTERVEKHSTNPTSRSLGLIAIIGVDILIDGLLMGISFLAGAKQRAS